MARERGHAAAPHQHVAVAGDGQAEVRVIVAALLWCWRLLEPAHWFLVAVALGMLGLMLLLREVGEDGRGEAD